MTRALPIAVLVLLAVASAWSVAHGMADETAGDVNLELFELDRTARQTGALPSQETIRQLEAKAAMATSLAPYNGFYWNADARVHFAPRVQAGGTGGDTLGAYRAIQRSVVLQPTSGYQWSGVLYAADQLNQAGQLPGGMGTLEHALLRATHLGAREQQVLKNVLDIGFANWDKLSASSQTALTASIGHLAAREPDEVLLIAIRRGRVAMACEDKRLTTHRACVAARQVVAVPG